MSRKTFISCSLCKTHIIEKCVRPFVDNCSKQRLPQKIKERETGIEPYLAC